MSCWVGVAKEIKPFVGHFAITAAAPRAFSRAQAAQMQPGSVVACRPINKGGCIETTRASTYDAPTYIDEGVLHFCVTNMPGAVPRSATQVLSAAMLPFPLALPDPQWRNDARLARAIDVSGGQAVHPALKSG